MQAALPREDELDGRDYLVLPVVMSRGTRGGIDLEDVVEKWQGKPVVANSHPKINGEYVSVRTPKMMASHAIGTVFNVRVDGDLLRGEAWFDVRKTLKASSDIISAAKAGHSLGCSTMYRDNIPDHLAISANPSGATSTGAKR